MAMAMVKVERGFSSSPARVPSEKKPQYSHRIHETSSVQSASPSATRHLLKLTDGRPRNINTSVGASETMASSVLNLTMTSVPARLISVTPITIAVASSPRLVSPIGTIVST